MSRAPSWLVWVEVCVGVQLADLGKACLVERLCPWVLAWHRGDRILWEPGRHVGWRALGSEKPARSDTLGGHGPGEAVAAAACERERSADLSAVVHGLHCGLPAGASPVSEWPCGTEEATLVYSRHVRFPPSAV